MVSELIAQNQEVSIRTLFSTLTLLGVIGIGVNARQISDQELICLQEFQPQHPKWNTVVVQAFRKHERYFVQDDLFLKEQSGVLANHKETRHREPY